MTTTSALSRFRTAYGEQRAAEGRAHSRAESLALPYLAGGPLAGQWTVRARTFDAFMARVLRPLARSLARPVRLLDLGAGNGWLCWRASSEGAAATALDLRDDDVDGLGAAGCYLEDGPAFHRVVATFDALPLGDAQFDVVAFNASLHYATDLETALREARRVVRRGGRLAILDSPFYASARDGEAMVAEKRRTASQRFGGRADALMSIHCIEFLTPGRLASAGAALGVTWKRHRVRYPVWYEARPLLAALRGQRVPSRFDLWEGAVA